MKTINLNFTIRDLKGEALKDEDGEITAGKVLANNLSQHDKDPVKFFDWAQKLYKGENLILDNADFTKLYQFVEQKSTLRNIAKGPILKYLDDVKEQAKKEKEHLEVVESK